MSTLVIDASVAVKTVVQETLSEQAEAVLRTAFVTGNRIVGPVHFVGEVLNAIYQRTRRGDPAYRLRHTAAQAAIEEFLSYPIEPLDIPSVYRHAFELALTHQLPTIYDAMYVALAAELQAPLWTADRRLLAALGNAFPFVRPLTDVPL